MHPVASDTAHPALLDRHRFGVKTVGDAESLRVAVGAVRGGLGQIIDDDPGSLRRQPAGAVEQHVVVADQIGRRAHRVPPAAVAGRRSGRHPVSVRDLGDDGGSAVLTPELLSGAVVRSLQHGVQCLVVVRGQCGPALGLLQEQIVGDEEFGHRCGADDRGVAVGDQLVGSAIEDGCRERGAACGGFVGCPLDACL